MTDVVSRVTRWHIMVRRLQPAMLAQADNGTIKRGDYDLPRPMDRAGNEWAVACKKVRRDLLQRCIHERDTDENFPLRTRGSSLEAQAMFAPADPPHLVFFFFLTG